MLTAWFQHNADEMLKTVSKLVLHAVRHSWGGAASCAAVEEEN